MGLGRAIGFWATVLCVPALAAGQAAPAPRAKKAAVATPAAPVQPPPPAPKAPAGPGEAGKGEPEKGDSQKAAVGGEKTDVGPAERKELLFEKMGRGPEEEQELEEFSQAVREYEEQSKEFRKEVQLLIEKKYDEKRDTLSQSYEKAIRDLEVIERKERLDAIALFEEFLQRYPDDARYTPDVIFRLAELHYEKTQDDQALALRDYEEQLKKYEAKQITEQPKEPGATFEKSIALYQRLITQFPDYRLNDGAYYLLGYCLEKQGELEQSQVTYAKLIERYPKSKFIPEAWVRVGEYNFDAVNLDGALERAVDAYTHAVAYKDHPLYDKALYKLGWAYYRMDRFDEAVANFLSLIDFYEKKSKDKGEEEVGGDLRAEALQYTAISFADEKWGGVAKAQEVFRKLGPRPYEAEVYRRLGDVLFDQTKHGEAVAAYKLFLEKNPLSRDAPKIQDKVVTALERDRNFDQAFAERERLVGNYAPGTPWYDKYRHDPDVIKEAQELSERSLYSAAVFHHQQALAFKQQEKFDLALKEFQVAARGYGAYLKRFPHSKLAYELTFYDAECLYNSFDFEAAAKQYAWVRDSTADTKYKNDAAYAAVLAFQKSLDKLQADGKLASRKVLKASDRKEGEKIVAEELEEPWKGLVAASDVFLSVSPKHEKAPNVAYKAAEGFYVHNQFDEARRRFEAIVASYPKAEVAKFATNLILETYLAAKDWKSVISTTDRFTQGDKPLVDPKGETGKIWREFGDSAKFKLAEQLMDQKKWEEAAKLYIGLVDQNKGYQFADKSLNNAAVCYENARRFDSALRLFERLYSEYPKSTLADAALFRVAVNAENSYDFDKAVDRYLLLVEKYPGSKDRESALFNAARLLEGQQRYPEAARAFMRYAELFPKSEDAGKNQYRAALIYDKMSDYRGEIKSLDDFVRKFSRDSNQSELLVEANQRIGEAYEKLSQGKQAQDYFKKTVQEYERRGLKAEKRRASAAAAEAAFKLAEIQFEGFDKIKITGTGKKLLKSFEAKQGTLKSVAKSYDEVPRFKTVDWTLAAFYRKAYLLERFASTLVDTPVPPEVKKLGEEAVVAYTDILSQKAALLQDKAVESYKVTLGECRNQHLLNNQWCKRTLESLNRFEPKAFPLLKDPKIAMAENTLYPAVFADTPEGPTRKVALQSQDKLSGDEK